MVSSAIATDTLLVENDAERLEKGEEADAIDEYERERDGRPTRAEEERIAEIRRQREAEAAQREAEKQKARERAEREAAAPLPEGWTRHRNPDARPNARPYYYHNAGCAKAAARRAAGDANTGTLPAASVWYTPSRSSVSPAGCSTNVAPACSASSAPTPSSSSPSSLPAPPSGPSRSSRSGTR